MPRPQITEWTRWIFASGGVCTGVVLVNAQYFLLIYYSQVLGLSASLAGLAMAIALVFDAVSDPAVGFISDNWKSRWGRRHPFLYASILPIALFSVLLWFPPADLGQLALFSYLLVCIVGLRIALTIFEIPSNSLVPELTTDYDERTRLFTYKESAYWIVGAIAGGVVMYAVFLRPTPEYPDGLLNPEGYRDAAAIYASIAVAALLVSAVGLHRFIPYLSVPDAAADFGPRHFLRQSLDALRIPSLRTMLIATIVSATGTGVTMALWAYLYGFFWAVPTIHMSHMMLASALGAVPALYFQPRLIAGREKRSLAVGLTLVGILLNTLPVALRLLDAFPENGSDALYWVLVLQNFVVGIVAVLLMGIMASMLADLVEQSQLATAHRPEGLIMATVTFSKKAAMALGTALAGALLDLAAFPTAAAVGEVPAPILFRFGLIYMPVLLVSGVVGAYFLGRYKVARADHERAVAALHLDGAPDPRGVGR